MPGWSGGRLGSCRAPQRRNEANYFLQSIVAALSVLSASSELPIWCQQTPWESSEPHQSRAWRHPSDIHSSAPAAARAVWRVGIWAERAHCALFRPCPCLSLHPQLNLRRGYGPASPVERERADGVHELVLVLSGPRTCQQRFERTSAGGAAKRASAALGIRRDGGGGGAGSTHSGVAAPPPDAADRSDSHGVCAGNVVHGVVPDGRRADASTAWESGGAGRPGAGISGATCQPAARTLAQAQVGWPVASGCEPACV